MRTSNFRIDNPCWDDAIGDVRTQLTGSTQWTLEAYRDTGLIMPFLIYDQTDFFQLTIQIPHRKKLNTEVRVHAHIIPMAAGNGDFKLNYSYAFVSPGEVLPAVSSWTGSTATKALVTADQYKHKIFDLFSFTPANEASSGILVAKFTNNVTGNYETSKDHGTAKANIAIAYLDAHIQCDSLGSEQEYVKGNY
jgi:hypothetical protein